MGSLSLACNRNPLGPGGWGREEASEAPALSDCPWSVHVIAPVVRSFSRFGFLKYLYLEPEFKLGSVSVETLFLITTLNHLREKCRHYLFLLQLVTQIVSINQLFILILLGFKGYI